MLEVDHIIPKSKGGKETINNLITACFDCNRGKWSKQKWESKKSLYKAKLSDASFEALKFFFEERNSLGMGTICWKTLSFVKMGVTSFGNSTDYQSWLDYKPLRKEEEFIGYEEADLLFKLWGDFCDEVVAYMLYHEKESISSMLKYCFDDDNWRPTEKVNYSDRLNYYLTEDNVDWYKSIDKLYVLKKFTLFPNLLDNGEE